MDGAGEITGIAVTAQGSRRVLWFGAFVGLVAFLTIDSKLGSSNYYRQYSDPQLRHSILPPVGQSFAKCPISLQRLHSTPSAERGSVQSDA